MFRPWILFAGFTGCLTCLSTQTLAQENAQNEDWLIILEDEEASENGTSAKSSINSLKDDSNHVLTLDTVDIVSTPENVPSPGARPEFAQKLETPQTQSLNDWLETAPGVFGHTSSKGQRTIMVRGFETRHISMEFDGIPLETGYDGMTGLDVLPMNWVGTAKLYHADTNPTDGSGLGGKAAFSSVQPERLEAALEISRGSVRGSLSHGMTLDAWRWAATAGGHYSNGFYLSQNYEPNPREDGGLREASAGQGYNFMLKAGRTLAAWGDFELSTGYAQAPRDVPTGTSADYPRYWTFSDWKIAFAQAKLVFSNTYLSGQTQFWATHQGNTLNEYDDASRTTQTIAGARSKWQDNDFGGRIELTTSPYDLKSAGHISALLKADFHYQTHRVDDEQLAQNTLQTTHSDRFLYDIRPAFDWQILPQIRLFGSAQATGASVGDLPDLHNGGFNLGFDYAIDKFTLGIRTARRLRMPTMKEQYRGEIIGIDIPPLSPEAAWHTELEIHYMPHPQVAITAAVYDTEVRDLIDFKYIDGIKLAQNIDKSRLAGTDIALKIGPFWHLTLDLTYSYLYAWNLRDDHALNDRPAHNFRASLSYSPLSNLRLAIHIQYESERRTEAWMNSSYAWVGDIFLLGAEIEYQMEHFSILFKGTNLTDYNYMRAIGYPEEGFDLSLAAKFTW